MLRFKRWKRASTHVFDPQRDYLCAFRPTLRPGWRVALPTGLLGGLERCLDRADRHVLEVEAVAVGQGLTRPGERKRGDQAQLQAGLEQPVRQRPMIVAGRLETDDDRLLEAGEHGDQAVMVFAGVENSEPAPAHTTGLLDQDLVAVLGDVDGCQNSTFGCRLVGGHSRSPLRWRWLHHPRRSATRSWSPATPRVKAAQAAMTSQPANFPMCYGAEFVAKVVPEWITAVGAKAYIAPGSPWENGYIESFNARLRDELLDGEIFYTLREARIVIESWRRHGGFPPTCLTRLSSAGSRSTRPRTHCVAGCAHQTGSAGQATAGAKADHELTFNPDQSSGAGHACSRRGDLFSLQITEVLVYRRGPWGPQGLLLLRLFRPFFK